MHFKVLGKMIDTVRQKCYLHFGAARVSLVNRVLGDYFRLDPEAEAAGAGRALCGAGSGGGPSAEGLPA